MSFKYRPDIDGLRAIAVIPVILFHGEFSAFSGGYVGVDIFFVISGYLITSILLRDIELQRFSILVFYERRVRRIFPALFTVLAVSVLVALAIMFPLELESFGHSFLGATFFFSNYHFMADAGYFTTPAETKPLLHMWSLAVEEQFYILFPIYLYLADRFFKNRVGLVSLVMLVLSLVYSILLVKALPGDAFYSTPARAWELLAGAILALYPRKTALRGLSANLLAYAGLGMIGWAVFVYTRATPFPGVAALLPVVGSALLIYSGGANETLVGRVLSTRLFRYPGLVSYSLYLWHWPVFVLYKMYVIEPVTSLDIWALIGVTAVLATLSWRYVETPFRRRQVFATQRPILLAGVAVMFVSAIFGVIVVAKDGSMVEPSAAIRRVLSAEEDIARARDCEIIDKGTQHSLRVCQVGVAEEKSPHKPDFAVWGDSHGEAILPAIDESAKMAGERGIFVGRGGCTPLIDVNQARQGYDKCNLIADAFIHYLQGHPEITTVIMISRWAIYANGVRFRSEKGHIVYIKDKQTQELSLAENKRVFTRGLERTFDRLTSMGKKIIVVTQVPETEWRIPVASARAMLLNKQVDFRPSRENYQKRQAMVTRLFERYKARYGLEFIHPTDLMCNEKSCLVYDDGVPIYRDTNHVTSAWAKKLADVFAPIFRR